jgi:hypothetical protein
MGECVVQEKTRGSSSTLAEQETPQSNTTSTKLTGPAVLHKDEAHDENNATSTRPTRNDER